MEAQKPYCLAMVLCDAVHRDETTGKMTLLGTFSRVGSQSLPIKAQFCVYFAITDGYGTVPLGIRIVDSAALLTDDTEGDEVFATEMPDGLQFDSPLVTIEGVFGIRIEFSKPGVYHCELFSDDEMLMARRLIVTGPPEESEHAPDAS